MFGVIFDMDGTLLDTQQICFPAWNYAGGLQGIENMAECLGEVCGMNEAGCQEYLKINFPSLDVPEFRNKVAQYVIEHGVVKKKPGADKLLKFLKDNNIKMAIASGTPAKTVLDNLKEVNIAHYFDVIVGGDMVENCKPAPDIFLLAAKKLGIDPQECFVFEDSLNGIKAGYAAGMKCIGIPDMAAFNNEIKKLMKFELASLDEAIEIFKNYL